MSFNLKYTTIRTKQNYFIQKANYYYAQIAFLIRQKPVQAYPASQQILKRGKIEIKINIIVNKSLKHRAIKAQIGRE